MTSLEHDVIKDWEFFDTANKVLATLEEFNCPTCQNNSDLNDQIESDGYIVCTQCGLVLKRRISEIAE
jgi:transcription elongation factor Elf1